MLILVKRVHRSCGCHCEGHEGCSCVHVSTSKVYSLDHVTFVSTFVGGTTHLVHTTRIATSQHPRQQVVLSTVATTRYISLSLSCQSIAYPVAYIIYSIPLVGVPAQCRSSLTRRPRHACSSLSARSLSALTVSLQWSTMFVCPPHDICIIS
jgi:hypothetical protein